MKRIFRLSLLSVSLSATAFGVPFLAIGDGAEIFVTGVLSISGDDNVLLTGSKTSDLVFGITPGAELTFGKDGQLKGVLSANVAFSNYSDNSRLNTVLFGSDFRADYDDGKTKLSVTAGFHESNQNSPDVTGLTRRDSFATGGNAEVEVSQLLSASIGMDFSHDNYKKAGYTDADSLTIPLNVYYKWTPKSDLSLGYRYRDYRVDIGEDTKDHYLNIGARGEFTPKLSGKLSVGYNMRNFATSGDSSDLGYDADLAYTFTEKTNFNFGGSKDFSTTPQGQQQRNTSVRASVTTKLNEQWTVNGGMSYRWTAYTTRDDGYFEGNVGVAYVYNSIISFRGTYNHRINSSGAAGGDFTNNVFALSSNIRY